MHGASKLASDKLFVASNDSYAGGHRANFQLFDMATSWHQRLVIRLLNTKKIFPITDVRMTRFMITLQQAVEFVWFAFNEMAGGEVFVKKYPNGILDIASAVDENIEHKLIGIRPGEKLHKMISI